MGLLLMGPIILAMKLALYAIVRRPITTGKLASYMEKRSHKQVTVHGVAAS